MLVSAPTPIEGGGVMLDIVFHKIIYYNYCYIVPLIQAQCIILIKCQMPP